MCTELAENWKHSKTTKGKRRYRGKRNQSSKTNKANETRTRRERTCICTHCQFIPFHRYSLILVDCFLSMSTPLRTPKANKCWRCCYRTIYIYTCDSVRNCYTNQMSTRKKARNVPRCTYECMLRIFVNVNILFFILAQKTH